MLWYNKTMNTNIQLQTPQLLPREKLLKHGVSALNDGELLALLVGSGSKGLSVHTISTKIAATLTKNNLTLTSLLAIDGINVAKAAAVLAALELGKRVYSTQRIAIPSITTPNDVLPLLTEIRNQKKENFVAIYLNSRNHLIKKEVVSIGTLNGSLVHPREVFEPAIQNLAAHIIIAHNHPSGDEEPSDADIHITKRLVDAGAILGIEIVDHIIVTESSYYSFKEHRKI